MVGVGVPGAAPDNSFGASANIGPAAPTAAEESCYAAVAVAVGLGPVAAAIVWAAQVGQSGPLDLVRRQLLAAVVPTPVGRVEALGVGEQAPLGRGAWGGPRVPARIVLALMTCWCWATCGGPREVPQRPEFYAFEFDEVQHDVEESPAPLDGSVLNDVGFDGSLDVLHRDSHELDEQETASISKFVAAPEGVPDEIDEGNFVSDQELELMEQSLHDLRGVVQEVEAAMGAAPRRGRLKAALSRAADVVSFLDDIMVHLQNSGQYQLSPAESEAWMDHAKNAGQKLRRAFAKSFR